MGAGCAGRPGIRCPAFGSGARDKTRLGPLNGLGCLFGADGSFALLGLGGAGGVPFAFQCLSFGVVCGPGGGQVGAGPVAFGAHPLGGVDGVLPLCVGVADLVGGGGAGGGGLLLGAFQSPGEAADHGVLLGEQLAGGGQVGGGGLQPGGPVLAFGPDAFEVGPGAFEVGPGPGEPFLGLGETPPGLGQGGAGLVSAVDGVLGLLLRLGPGGLLGGRGAFGQPGPFGGFPGAFDGLPGVFAGGGGLAVRGLLAAFGGGPAGSRSS